MGRGKKQWQNEGTYFEATQPTGDKKEGLFLKKIRSIMVCCVKVYRGERKSIFHYLHLYHSLSASLYLAVSLFISIFYIFLSHHLTAYLSLCVYEFVSVVYFQSIYYSFNHFREDADRPSLGNMHTSQKHHPVHGMQAVGIVPIPLIRNRDWISQIFVLLEMTFQHGDVCICYMEHPSLQCHLSVEWIRGSLFF